MPKSWRRLAGEELLAWGKAGAIVGKEMTETCVNELGKVAGHKGRKFEIETHFAMLEWARKVRERRR